VELALRAVGVVSGDKVVTVANTANATVSAIERIGAKPVFTDVNEETFTMDVESLSEILANQKVRAVVPVHLYGHPADMPEICAMARAADVAVVEDCAQAHGAMISGKKVGTFGDAAAFSFYPTKNLGAFGDGGIVVTSSDVIADRLFLLRQYGWRNRYESEIKGVNSRIDELQAAVLSVKLNSLETKNERRTAIAERYSKEFSRLSLTVPSVLPGCGHVFHQYTLQNDNRDGLASHLDASGVGTAVLYPVSIHRQQAYLADFSGVRLPVAERLADRILSIPVYPELTDDEVSYVIEAVKSFFLKA
jgi:dTDP-4-amino-4,6-dideoxygalactose transaminase